MTTALAYADAPDTTGMGWYIIVIALGAITGSALLALVPIALARRRLRRPIPALTLAALLWTLLTAGSIIYASAARLSWNRDQLTLLRTGYYAPGSSTPPNWPWPLWLVLGIVYGVLIGLALLRNRPANSGASTGGNAGTP